MPVNNENIVGAINELLELFKKQQIITDNALNSNQKDNSSLNKEREEARQIATDFDFLSNFILENVSVADNHRYIGKMLLNARHQADELIKEAQVQVEKLKVESAELNDKVEQQRREITAIPVVEKIVEAEEVIEEVSEEVRPVVQEEIVEPEEAQTVVPVKATELTTNHMHKTQEIHQKYKDSLDSILKEIDVFLER